MNINTLKYVLKIAEAQNITKAAASLYISQSALSQNLQSLETELGHLLFDRSSSPITPTPAGILFLDWAKRVIDSETQLRNKLADLSTNSEKALRVGLSPQKSVQVFPSIIRDFYIKTTGCKIILEEHPSDVLLNMLDDNEIDILFDIYHSERLDFSFVPIAEEKIFIAAPESFAIPCKAVKHHSIVNLQDIIKLPLISLSPKQYLGKVVKSLYSYGNSLPNICMECRSADMALKMVSTGLGITVVPEFAIKNNHFTNIRYYTLESPELKRVVGISYRKDRYLPQDSNIFISTIKNFLNENSAETKILKPIL